MAQKPKKGEKSYLEQFAQILPTSVAFRFQELTGAVPHAPNSRVVWKSFETFTYKHQAHLFLVLGLQNGFQVYKLYDDGSCLCPIVSHIEDCPIALVKVLSYPTDSLVRWPENAQDKSHKRSSAPSPGAFFAVTSGAERNTFSRSCVKIFSVQGSKYVHTLRFKEPIRGMESGQSTLVVALSKEIYVYKVSYQPALEFELLFQTPCFANPEHYAVMALGPRWLAFPGCEAKLPTPSVSASPSLSPSITGQPVASSDSLVNMAQGIASGIYTLGGIGRQRLAAMFQGESNPVLPIEEKMNSNPHAGTIVVRDIANQQILVHFKAHNSAISCLGFNKKGTLLVSVPEDGQYLSVFQVIRFPVESKSLESGRSRGSMNIVQLYLLFRGVTHATIRSLAFSSDSKWLSASSLKGTTHIFAISESGGPATSKHATEEPLSYLTPNLEPSMCTASALARIKHGPGVDVSVVMAFQRLSTGDPIDHLVILNNVDVLTIHRLVALQSEKPPFALGLDVHPVTSWDLSASGVKVPPLMPFFDDLESRAKGRGKLRKTLALAPLKPPVPSVSSDSGSFSEDEADVSDPAVIHVSGESSSDVASRWLSHVELETSQPTIPIWSTPQFSIFEFKRSKRNSNAIDGIFIEDCPTESLKYEKYRTFSGMVTPNASEPIDSQIECALEEFGNFGPLAVEVKNDGMFPLISNQTAIELGAAMLTINEGVQHFALPSSEASVSPSSKQLSQITSPVLVPSTRKLSFALPPSALPPPVEEFVPQPSSTHSTSPLLTFFSSATTESFAASSRSPSFVPTTLLNPPSSSPSLTASLSMFPSPSLTPSLASSSPSLCSISPKSASASTTTAAVTTSATTTSTNPTTSPALNSSPATHKRSRRRKGSAIED